MFKKQVTFFWVTQYIYIYIYVGRGTYIYVYIFIPFNLYFSYEIIIKIINFDVLQTIYNDKLIVIQLNYE